MKTERNTFNLLFLIKKQKAKSNGEAPLYIRLTVNKKRLEMSLHRDVPIDLWDDTLRMAKGNTKPSKLINKYILSVQTSMYEHFKLLRESDIYLTPNHIKDAYLGIEVEKEEKITLVNLFQEHNEDLQKRIGVDYSKSTITKYKTTLKHIKGFLKSK